MFKIATFVCVPVSLTRCRFDENKARFYFRQLIKGVKYCHGQGVCHRCVVNLPAGVSAPV